MKWAVLLTFGSIGLIIFIFGIGWGWKRYALMQEGVRAVGTVVEVIESSSTDTDHQGRVTHLTSYYPIVEFASSDGQLHKFRGSTGEGVPSYFVGTKVDMIYRASRPDDAQITDFMQFWLGPIVVSVFGFIFLVMGVASFFLIRQDP